MGHRFFANRHRHSIALPVCEEIESARESEIRLNTSTDCKYLQNPPSLRFRKASPRQNARPVAFLPSRCRTRTCACLFH